MANEKLIPLSEVKKKITAVRQYFSGYPSTEQDKLARSVAKLCMEEVGKIKPVDAVEVVYGRWIKVADLCGIEVLRCSACGREHPRLPTAYCCDCGAKMDGERRSDGEAD